jgi:hypothetical protein
VGLIGLGLLRNLLIPAYVMFAIACPFFVVYLMNKRNWWALIPGGIMGVIGISFMLASPTARYVVPVILIGIGIIIIIKHFVQDSQVQ